MKFGGGKREKETEEEIVIFHRAFFFFPSFPSFLLFGIGSGRQIALLFFFFTSIF